MEMTMRIGLIGAGEAGKAYVRAAAQPEVTIAAVCDSDRALAEKVAAPYGASVHINFRSLLETERLDAVLICVPAYAHGEPEVLAARAGIHIFVEPPIALNNQKAAEVQKEIERAGIVAAAGYSWRALSGATRLKDMLARHRLGFIQALHVQGAPRTDWRRRQEASGGLVVQTATDLLDAMGYLAGEFSTVSAMAAGGIVASREPGYELEDACAALVAFRSGAIGQISCSTLAQDEPESGIRLWADGFEATLTSEQVEIVEPGRAVRERHAFDGLRQSLMSFLEAVRTGRPEKVTCTYAQAAATLRAALAISESAKAGRPISV